MQLTEMRLTIYRLIVMQMHACKQAYKQAYAVILAYKYIVSVQMLTLVIRWQPIEVFIKWLVVKDPFRTQITVFMLLFRTLL